MKTSVGRMALVVSLSLSVLVSTVHGLVIDDFTGDSDLVRSSTQNQTASKTVTTTAAIGGSRTLKATKLSSDPGSIEIETFDGVLYEAQGSSVSGITSVQWNAGAANYSGLGGIDLTQDLPNKDVTQGKIILKRLVFDSAFGKSAELIITIYDASDPMGEKKSSKTVLLDSIISYPGIDIEIPFTAFVPTGSSGPANFKNVGAIVLSINAMNPGIDIEIGKIMTNGKCDNNVPDNEGSVIDDCGVCGGHNESKDDCGVCPEQPGYGISRDECGICFGNNKDKDQCLVCFGNNKDMDQCGVCFGYNRDLDDCGVCGGNNLSKDLCGICGGDGSSCKDCLGVPNGNAKYDVCGICAGNGTSCLDCNGVPNGGAKKDICGICNGNGTSCLDCTGTPFGVSVFDRCGVCGGDGQSCIKCTEQDLSPLHQQMIQKSKDQKGNADFFLLKVLKSDPKYAKASKDQLQRIYRKLLAVMKKLPISTEECTENPFCTTQDSHTTLINTYKNEALKIYRISKQILARPQSTGGVCSTPGCEQRVSARLKKTASMKKYAYRLYMQNITLARRFPNQITVCD